MSWRTTVILVAAGLALGTVNAGSNYGLGPAAAHVSKVVGNDWGWLVASFLAAWAGRSWREAVARSLLVLLAAVSAYYVLDYVLIQRVMGYAPSPPGSYLFEAVMWACAAGVVSVVLGGLVRVVRRPGMWGIPAAAALPAFIAWTAHETTGQRWVDPILADVTAVLWPLAATVAVLAALARALLPPASGASESS